MYCLKSSILVLMEEEEGGTGGRSIGGWSQFRRTQQVALPGPSASSTAATLSREGESHQPATAQTPVAPSAVEDLIRLLTEERRKILDNERLTAKDKLALLEDNRKAIVVANGGVVRKTENVVYGLLIFGSVGLIVLALLTTFAGLPHEVTLSFVGTVLGGTIATIAQKLGNL